MTKMLNCFPVNVFCLSVMNVPHQGNNIYMYVFSILFYIIKSMLCCYLIHLQMIESSAHGDDYDGVIFSQLVRQSHLLLNWNFLSYAYYDFLFFFAGFFQNLIDLAGSESSKTETTGLRRKEGSYINKSLLTLGTVGVIKCLYFLLRRSFVMTNFFSPLHYF